VDDPPARLARKYTCPALFRTGLWEVVGNGWA
jgi:hypothetical protein